MPVPPFTLSNRVIVLLLRHRSDTAGIFLQEKPLHPWQLLILLKYRVLKGVNAIDTTTKKNIKENFINLSQWFWHKANFPLKILENA